MRYVVSLFTLTFLLSSHANAIGKREEGALIGVVSTLLVTSALQDRRSTYDRHDTRSEFPPFRCHSDSVQCAYERGVYEREHEKWLEEKDAAYRCGRYGDCK